MSDDLITPEELAEMEQAASVIEAQPVAPRTDFAGSGPGPRVYDVDEALVALSRVREQALLVEAMEEDVDHARLALLELVEHAVTVANVQHVAKAGGFKQRTGLYKALHKLPELRQRLRNAPRVKD